MVSKKKIRENLILYNQINKIDERFINKIICGDAVKTLQSLPDNSVDIIITSPPYNFEMEYDNYHDKKGWEKYFSLLNDVWKECYRVLKHGGRICVNVQPLFSEYIPTHHLISKQLLDLGFLWKSEILWDKHNYNAKFTAWGSWRSASMPYLKYTWEFIEVFSKGSQKKEKLNGEQNDITADEFKKWVNAKWDIAPERNMKEYEHPAMFPEELPRRLIKLFSFVDDIVLDPFNGAGTTTTMAKSLGRRYIGIDVSPKYCKYARERLKTVNKKLIEYQH